MKYQDSVIETGRKILFGSAAVILLIAGIFLVALALSHRAQADPLPHPAPPTWQEQQPDSGSDGEEMETEEKQEPSPYIRKENRIRPWRDPCRYRRCQSA